jgi:lambda family phage portal protein
MDLYESAELTRKQNRAKFNGAIYRETDEENPITDAAVKVEDDRALVDVEEGYFFKLAQNERVDLYGGDSGNAGVIDFIRTQLRSIAAGMGVPYELMTGDYEGTNDRIMRVILNTFYRRLEMMQDLLVMQVLQPIWAAFLDAAVLSGTINIPGYFDARKRWQRCEWRAHAWSYVNPLQEAQTQKILVDEGFESRSAIVAARGWDAEEVDRQNHEDMLREQQYGLDYGKDPAPASQQDTSQQ